MSSLQPQEGTWKHLFIALGAKSWSSFDFSLKIVLLVATAPPTPSSICFSQFRQSGWMFSWLWLLLNFILMMHLKFWFTTMIETRQATEANQTHSCSKQAPSMPYHVVSTHVCFENPFSWGLQILEIRLYFFFYYANKVNYRLQHRKVQNNRMQSNE